MEVNRSNRLQKQFEPCTLFSKVSPNHFCHFLFDNRYCSPWPKEDIRIELIPTEPFVSLGMGQSAHRKQVREREMGIQRDVTHDTGDTKGNGVLHQQCLAKRVVVAEILFREGFCENDRIWLGQTPAGIAFRQAVAEHGGRRGVSVESVRFIETTVAASQKKRARKDKSRHGVDLRDLVPDREAPWPVHLCDRSVCCAFDCQSHSVQAVFVLIVLIVTQFIANIHEDQNAACQSQRKADNVYQRITSLPPHCPERNFHEMADHRSLTAFWCFLESSLFTFGVVYSYLNDSTGLVPAARIACALTVARAMTAAAPP